MTGTIHDRFLEAATRFPDDVAVIQGKRRVRYGELRASAGRLAERLSSEGLSPGDRVLILLENSPEYVSTYFAVLIAGGIAVPLGDKATARGVEAAAADCRPYAVVARPESADAVRSMLPPLSRKIPVLSPDEGRGGSGEPEAALGSRGRGDPALILYTSGTTGRPKGVLLSHGNLAGNADSIVASLRLTRRERVAVVLPFHYSYGNSLLTTHMTLGASMLLENSFLYPNRFLEAMIREEATGLPGVPSTFSLLLSRSTVRRLSFPHLRYLAQAGGPLPPAHAAELANAFPGKEIYIMYGQTEATARLTCLAPDEFDRKPGSIGKPIPGVSISLYRDGKEVTTVGETGEIVARGDNVMAGYWGDPDATRRAVGPEGLHTGDIARMDDGGYLYIVGRESDFIKSGGHRIGTREIEDVLCEMPGVAEAAVVGTPDPILGEALRAFVVPRSGAKLDRRAILAHCRSILPLFKIPRDLEIRPELPRTDSGKIRKADLQRGPA